MTYYTALNLKYCHALVFFLNEASNGTVEDTINGLLTRNFTVQKCSNYKN